MMSCGITGPERLLRNRKRRLCARIGRLLFRRSTCRTLQIPPRKIFLRTRTSCASNFPSHKNTPRADDLAALQALVVTHAPTTSHRRRAIAERTQESRSRRTIPMADPFRRAAQIRPRVVRLDFTAFRITACEKGASSMTDLGHVAPIDRRGLSDPCPTSGEEVVAREWSDHRK